MNLEVIIRRFKQLGLFKYYKMNILNIIQKSNSSIMLLKYVCLKCILISILNIIMELFEKNLNWYDNLKNKSDEFNKYVQFPDCYFI